MDADGLTVAVEAFGPALQPRLAAAFERLARDGAVRTGMGAKLAALCDGLGVERVASRLA